MLRRLLRRRFHFGAQMVFDRELHVITWIFLIFPLLVLFTCETDTHCSRPLSRIVRNQLQAHVFSVLELRNQESHSKCPLHPSNDLYSVQEGHKIQEHGTKWVCNFCGKAFYNENYLDRHFDNKHSDRLVKGSTVCLADFCDIFRCEVFENERSDHFWEKKLCNEDRMHVHKKRCETLIRSCLPQANLSVEQELEIYDAIGANTCSLLNCKDYWKPPNEMIPAWKIILYSVVTPFFLMGLIVYYYAMIDYYFGDFPVESEASDDEERRFSSSRNSGQNDLRRRYTGRPLMY